MDQMAVTAGATPAAGPAPTGASAVLIDGLLYRIRPRVKGCMACRSGGARHPSGRHPGVPAQGEAGPHRAEGWLRRGACGACTVIMDGAAVLSCMVLAVEADGPRGAHYRGPAGGRPGGRGLRRAVRAGLRHRPAVRLLHPGVRDDGQGLSRTRTPTPRSTRCEGPSGNLCRCGCYDAIAQAVLRAAEKMRKAEKLRAAATEGRNGGRHSEGVA